MATLEAQLPMYRSSTLNTAQSLGHHPVHLSQDFNPLAMSCLSRPGWNHYYHSYCYRYRYRRRADCCKRIQTPETLLP